MKRERFLSIIAVTVSFAFIWSACAYCQEPSFLGANVSLKFSGYGNSWSITTATGDFSYTLDNSSEESTRQSNEESSKISSETNMNIHQNNSVYISGKILSLDMAKKTALIVY